MSPGDVDVCQHAGHWRRPIPCWSPLKCLTHSTMYLHRPPSGWYGGWSLVSLNYRNIVRPIHLVSNWILCCSLCSDKCVWTVMWPTLQYIWIVARILLSENLSTGCLSVTSTHMRGCVISSRQTLLFCKTRLFWKLKRLIFFYVFRNKTTYTLSCTTNFNRLQQAGC